MKHFKIPLGIVALLVLAFLVVPAMGAEARGKIKSVDADKNTFVLTTSDNKDLKCEMKDDAKIRVNDKAGRLRDLKVNDDVTVTYQVQDGRNMVTEIRCARKE